MVLKRYLSAQQDATNYPTREEEVTENEKLTEEIEFVLNDGVATAGVENQFTVLLYHPRKRRSVIRKNTQGKQKKSERN